MLHLQFPLDESFDGIKVHLTVWFVAGKASGGLFIAIHVQFLERLLPLLGYPKIPRVSHLLHTGQRWLVLPIAKEGRRTALGGGDRLEHGWILGQQLIKLGSGDHIGIDRDHVGESEPAA